MISVYYDGKCGLCAKEINHYMKIAPLDKFEWVDVTESQDALTEHGISYAQSLKLLHVKDHDGTIYKEIRAFAVIWSNLNKWYWSVFACLIKLPIILQISNGLYRLFAAWRFKKLKHCQLALKKEQGSK